MANYISSNTNRFYVAAESSFGVAASVTSDNRFPAEKLELRQVVERIRRTDKTGTRTYLGQSSLGRRATEFLVKSYLSAWDVGDAPHYGPLFMGATGGDVENTSGCVVATVSGRQVQTIQAHSLRVGSPVSLPNEIRFVDAVVDSTTVLLNVPFSNPPQPGDIFTSALGYRLGASLPSLTLYDYWDPISAVSRIATGAAVDKLKITVNGDYHEFAFSGQAADLFDSRTFQSGEGGMTSYPSEPMRVPFDPSGVPGHLGKAWIGDVPTEFMTLTEATIQIDNNLGVRNQEFGALTPRAIVPGQREISVAFTILAQDDEQSLKLYAAAKQRTTVAVMLQLGIQRGRVLGIYLPEVVPDLPAFDDSDTRLRWTFSNNFAQGSDNDELYLAFA